MDLVTLAIGATPALVVGIILGRYSNRLSLERDRVERRIADETERLDHCGEIFSARWHYVVTWHRSGRPTADPLKAKRTELEHRYPRAMPEIVLEGTSEWQHYHETEQAMVKDALAPTLNAAPRRARPADQRGRRRCQSAPR